MEVMELTKVPHGQRWGRWEYNSSNLTLVFKSPEGWEYEVDLEQCNSSSGILDWILQLSQKMWTTPEDIGNLVLGLDELAGYGLQGMIYGDASIDYKGLLQ